MRRRGSRGLAGFLGLMATTGSWAQVPTFEDVARTEGPPAHDQAASLKSLHALQGASAAQRRDLEARLEARARRLFEAQWAEGEAPTPDIQRFREDEYSQSFHFSWWQDTSSSFLRLGGGTRTQSIEVLVAGFTSIGRARFIETDPETVRRPSAGWGLLRR